MKAMVLAAGYGTRLGDLTRDIPKPMLLVEGKPLLEYIVIHLKAHGFNEIVMNLHFQPDVIRTYFGDGSAWGVRLTYSYEEALLGTAGGLKNVARFFDGEEDFLVHYGDILTDEDFTSMLRYHRAQRAMATLLVHKRVHSNSVLTVAQDGRIEGFLERPGSAVPQRTSASWVNSGVCIARHDLLDAIPPGRADLPRDVYVPLVEKNATLFAWPLSRYRCAIDSVERLQEARQAVRSGVLQVSSTGSPAHHQ